MGKECWVFINTIAWDKERSEKIDAELGRLPKWRVVRRHWLLWRRGKLAEKILKQQAIKDRIEKQGCVSPDNFFRIL